MACPPSVGSRNIDRLVKISGTNTSSDIYQYGRINETSTIPKVQATVLMVAPANCHGRRSPTGPNLSLNINGTKKSRPPMTTKLIAVAPPATGKRTRHTRRRSAALSLATNPSFGAKKSPTPVVSTVIATSASLTPACTKPASSNDIRLAMIWRMTIIDSCCIPICATTIGTKASRRLDSCRANDALKSPPAKLERQPRRPSTANNCKKPAKAVAHRPPRKPNRPTPATKARNPRTAPKMLLTPTNPTSWAPCMAALRTAA